MKKDTFRHFVPWVIAADFPLLYVGAVTLEIAAITIAAAAIMCVATLIAAVVY